MTQAQPGPGASWRLECRDVCIERAGRRLLDEVSLAITPGECISIVGPNGAGKTTLLHVLLGILQPTRGTVLLDGFPIRQMSARARGRFASYLPQSIERPPALTVREIVAGGRFPHVGPLRPLSAHDERIIANALDTCGLSALAGRLASELSGGERQKTLLAAAIAQDAELMLLDEPDTALDPAYLIELVRLLRVLHAAGRALVVISHDLQVPAALGGRVIAMRAGRVIADGPGRDVLRPASLSEVYGAPFEMIALAGNRQLAVPRWESNATSD